MNRAELMARLTSLAEDDYRRFAASLLPGVDNLLGVRLPRLRRLARDIARGDGVDAIGRLFTEATFEEVMLEGMVTHHRSGDQLSGGLSPQCNGAVCRFRYGGCAVDGSFPATAC